MTAVSLPAAADANLRVLDRVALGAILLMPLFLLHARALAEATIAVADLCFLARCTVTGDWTWLRSHWLRVGLIWWAWILLCTLPIPALGLGAGGVPALLQILVMVRFLVLIAAMEHALLRPPAARRWLRWVVTASALYIAVQSVIQFAFGRNLYGYGRYGDGELTGPFSRPRAAPALVRILFPALLPPLAALLRQASLVDDFRLTALLPPLVALLRRRGTWPLLAGYALLLASMAVMVLIGQRMPLLLSLLGLVVTALLLRPLRPVALAGGAVALLLVAASPVIAPQAHHRLVSEFSTQMENFATTQYGELYARAWEIGVRHPLTGLGMDGFRYGCPQPRYFRPSFDGRAPDGGGAVICWHHPHNYYFEALDDGGFPGLLLFGWVALAWLGTMARALWRRPRPVLVGLFAAALIQLWPIASTTGFFTMPIAGWSFLLLGWGMAEARWGDAPEEVGEGAPAPYIPPGTKTELS